MSTYQTISEILVLSLTFVACARVPFLKKAQLDPLSVISVITFILALLMLGAIGITPSGMAVAAQALLVFLWNLPAVAGFRKKKRILHIGLPFRIASALHLLAALVLIAAVFQTRPVRARLRKFNVRKTAYSYSGTFADGFTPIRQVSQTRNTFWEKYERQRTLTTDAPEAQKIILFIPGECAAISTYEPFLVKLARDGFTVYAAEFFCPDMHWFYGVYDSKVLRRYMFCYTRMRGDDRYRAAMNHKTFNLYKEYTAMLQEVAPSEEDFVCLVGDDQINTACKSVQEANASLVDDYFDLADVAGYTTPGYGPVEQTYPLLARLLGYRRDPSLYASIHLATVLERHIRGGQQ